MHEYKYCPLCASPLEDVPLAGQIRRACFNEGCGFVHWGNPVPVVAALVEHVDSGMMVLARNQAWPDGMFGLITGFLEREEAPAAAAAREVKEELDLDVDLAHGAHLIGVYPFPRKNEVLICYHLLARGEIRLNEELAEYRLVAPERLKPWASGTGVAVADWLAARFGADAGAAPD